MPFSEKLKLNYKIEDEKITFEDNTVYLKSEMRYLKDLEDEDLINIHKIKNIFKGEVVR
jgi:hypothetical protein